MNPSPHHPPSTRAAVLGKVVAGLLIMTIGAVVLVPVAALTLFLARRLYARVAGLIADAVLGVLRIRLIVHREEPWPSGQVVYISNHPCTLDPFILAALRMPNVRFFLSGGTQKFVPFGILARLMGTFFTVPQDRPAERVRIFQRADRVLRRTGESVYLSPEGKRVPTGEIGAFNKGSFHLATSLRAPIVPIYLSIPPQVDPGKGFDARPGTVHVLIHRAIDTSAWRLEDVAANKERVRELYLAWHWEGRSAGHGSGAESPEPARR